MRKKITRIEIQPTILYRDLNTQNIMYRGRIEGNEKWELENYSSDKLRLEFIKKYGGCMFLFQPTKDFTLI